MDFYEYVKTMKEMGVEVVNRKECYGWEEAYCAWCKKHNVLPKW